MNQGQDQHARAKARFAMLSTLRAAGVVVMLLGLWIWHGDIVRSGGEATLGSALFLVGAVVSMPLPALLAKRWRKQDGR